MVLEEVSFYNIVGEEVSLSNLVAQMINFYELKRSVGETQITDFNEGSEIRNFIECMALMSYAILEDENAAGKLPFITLSYGTYLDRIGENPFIKCPRITGGYSQGSATFTLSSAQSNDIVIPGGTLLKDNVIGLGFVTDDDLTIFAGETTGTMSVTCITMGVDGNINSGTLTIIDDSDVNTSLVSVNNSESFMGGADYEDDESYRIRLLENVQSEGFGSLPYYKNLCESVDGVHDVMFVDATGYTQKALVNGYIKDTPDSVLLNVLEQLSYVNQIVMTHSFTVGKPDYVTVNLTFNLTVASECTTTELTNLVTSIVNGGEWDRVDFNGLNIGENLTKQRLVEGFIYLADVVSVDSVTVTGQSSEFSSTDIDDDEVVKLGTLTFNQTVQS